MPCWLSNSSAAPMTATAALATAGARPENAPASATMQTSSGAGEGVGTKRSKSIVSSTVAAVSAGPKITRHPNRMGLSRSSPNEVRRQH
ncbi:hypothetical protein ACVWW5_001387 [Bradyrhizobium sp. LM3.4]